LALQQSRQSPDATGADLSLDIPGGMPLPLPRGQRWPAPPMASNFAAFQPRIPSIPGIPGIPHGPLPILTPPPLGGSNLLGTSGLPNLFGRVMVKPAKRRNHRVVQVRMLS